MLKRISTHLLTFITVTTLIISGLLSLALTVPDIFGLNITLITSQKPIEQIILGVVGTLTLAVGVERILQARHIEQPLDDIRLQLVQIREAMVFTIDTFFMDDFPNSYRSDYRAATDCLLVGVTMARTISIPVIRDKLSEGHTIRILLVNPHHTAMEMAAERVAKPDIVARRVTTEETLNSLHEVKQSIVHKRFRKSGSLEIRTINNPLTFEAIALNLKTLSGILYLTHYPFKATSDTGPKPKFILRARDGKWYNFFQDEVFKLWESGYDWPPAQDAKQQHNTATPSV